MKKNEEKNTSKKEIPKKKPLLKKPRKCVQSKKLEISHSHTSKEKCRGK
jgi:hypothetical protein